MFRQLCNVYGPVTFYSCIFEFDQVFEPITFLCLDKYLNQLPFINVLQSAKQQVTRHATLGKYDSGV
jgi:hypothetical protein